MNNAVSTEDAPGLNVVLVHPLIPQNAGSTARLTAATNTKLHFIEPLGFELSDRYLKRAGLDYWPEVQLSVHKNWDQFLATTVCTTSQIWIFSKKATRDYYSANFKRGDFLVFGNETDGVPANFLDRHESQCLRIPMDNPNIRSLNLATSVGIALYEARRQIIVS